MIGMQLRKTARRQIVWSWRSTNWRSIISVQFPSNDYNTTKNMIKNNSISLNDCLVYGSRNHFFPSSFLQKPSTILLTQYSQGTPRHIYTVDMDIYRNIPCEQYSSITVLYAFETEACAHETNQGNRHEKQCVAAKHDVATNEAATIVRNDVALPQNTSTKEL